MRSFVETSRRSQYKVEAETEYKRESSAAPRQTGGILSLSRREKRKERKKKEKEMMEEKEKKACVPWIEAIVHHRGSPESARILLKKKKKKKKNKVHYTHTHILRFTYSIHPTHADDHNACTYIYLYIYI